MFSDYKSENLKPLCLSIVKIQHSEMVQESDWKLSQAKISQQFAKYSLYSVKIAAKNITTMIFNAYR